MEHETYPLQRFVTDLQRLAHDADDEAALLQALRPLAQRFARDDAWKNPHLYEVNPEQGFGVHKLHEEPDHSLAIFAVSWLPGRGAPPHDHGTWAVVVGVDGAERNTFWERLDDRSRPGYAQLRKTGEKTFGPGEALAMPSGIIHSVSNDSATTTLSLHLYGRHINFTTRSQFDPRSNTEMPFIVAVEPAH